MEHGVCKEKTGFENLPNPQQEEGETIIVIRSEDESSKQKVVDTVSGELVNNEEKVCRICHLSGGNSTDLIHLGCSCKDELGISHQHCAEAWFGSKGNR